MALRDLKLKFRLDDKVSPELGKMSGKLGRLQGPLGIWPRNCSLR